VSPALTRLRHDLRTAVNHILGYGEMLLEEAEVEGPDERIERLREVRAAGLEVLALVDVVLAAGVSSEDAAIASLRVGLGPLADGLLVTIARLEPVSPERDAGDLSRLATAAGQLLGFAGRALITGEVRSDAAAVHVDSFTGERSDSAGTATLLPDALPSRILVADDDPTNRDLLGRRLARDGHHVTFATNGREALALAEAGGQDLVMLDLMMPELDGDEVLRRMKASPELRDLPVLMISAHDEHAAVGRCIAMGADDYLPKPFDPVLLRARVGACLARKRARDQELEYLRQVRLLTTVAESLEAGRLDGTALAEVTARGDALGGLARVLERAAREIHAREQRLALQVQQLRIEIDETRKARAVAEIVESDYFHELQRRAAELRRQVS
jgi:two-component system, cell cycle response regulator